MGEMSFTGPVGWGGQDWGRGGVSLLCISTTWLIWQHITHTNKTHIVRVNKRRGSRGVRVYLEKGGKGGGAFNSVQCVDHGVEWLPGTEAEFLHLQRDTSRGCFSPVRRPESQHGLPWETDPANPPPTHPPQCEPSEGLQLFESAWKQITPRLTGRSSIRCAASNWLEFNYVKSELRLKGGNKQGALMFYSSGTPQNTSCIKQQQQPA